MEWVEVRGETLEAAKEEALDQLGVARDDAEFEIVQEAESRWMGLKKTEARVRARVRPTQPRAKKETGRGGRRTRSRSGKGGGNDNRGGDNRGGDNRGGEGRSRGGQRSRGQRSGGGGGRNGGQKSGGRQQGQSSGNRDGGARDTSERGRGSRDTPAHAKASSDDHEPRHQATKRSATNKETAVSDHASTDELVPIDEQREMVTEFLEGVVDAFGLTATVSTNVEDDAITGSIEGADLGLLIGPQGGTLRALQELTRSALQRQAGGRGTSRSRIDVGGYRERRRAALAEFAQRQAAQVIDEGIELALEPMNSADRKAIHDAVMEIDGVRSISEGDDPHRRVVLLPDD